MDSQPCQEPKSADPETLEHRYQELRNEYHRLLAHQALIDDRLLRVETNRLFRIWNWAFAKGLPIYNKIGRIFSTGTANRERHADEYARWVSHEQAGFPSWDAHRTLSSSWGYRPLITVVVSASDASWSEIELAIQSVVGQSYETMEICIAIHEETEPRLAEFVSKDNRGRCAVLTAVVPDGTGVSAATNAAASLARGEFLAFIDSGDQFSPFALHYVVEALQERRADILYSDEDRRDAAGLRVRPIFKPDWSPDLLTSCMYFGSSVVVRRELFHQAGGLQANLQNAAPYDLVLRLTEMTDEIRHIPRVLYHRRISAPQEQTEAHLAVERAMKRRNWPEARIESGPVAQTFLVRRKPPADAALTIIICSKTSSLLQRCLASIRASTKELRYEVIVVHHDEGKADPSMRKVLDEFGCKVLPYGGPFNFSLMNNLAARQATHPYLLFMNDDVRVESQVWAERILGELGRPEIGIVGATLFYPSGLIQHAGVALGVGDGAGHAGRFQTDSELWPWLLVTRDTSAVTGAFLGIRAALFRELEGFDACFATNYNDVDLCLRARAAGYSVECLGQEGIVHEECQTRMGITRFSERDLFYARWGHLLARPDPFYSANLSPTERIGLNFPGGNPRPFELLAG